MTCAGLVCKCGTDSPGPLKLQLLKALMKRVEELEKEVNGFNDTIEELRAAGRVEAMEDLMSSLMDNLVRPCTCCWA